MYYAVTDMGCFDDYLNAAPLAKKRRGNCITTFLLHFTQCITFCQTKLVTETLIAKALLKSLYSGSVFEVIKDFAKRLASNLIMSQENPKCSRTNNWHPMLNNYPTMCYNSS